MSDSTESSFSHLATLVEQDSPQIRSLKIPSGLPKQVDTKLRMLQEENRSLQLRVLGVNELARLLQDRIEVIQMLQDKNKRLEVAVVRLENRCSNFERKLKTQGGAVGPKPGQSPFIPGPSRQILEALMKENSELKKTLNNVTKRGASGYLEAVKMTQLEEVIDSQKQEVDFLKNQIQSLTTSSFAEEEAPRESGSSMPALGASLDSGPLKRQLIKLQHAMKVKDRFCTLLSQQVAELQQKITNTHRDSIDAGSGNETSTSVESESGPPVQEHTPHDTDPHSHLRDPSTPQDGEEPKEPDLHKQMAELEARYKQLVEEQKEVLEKEREDRMTLTLTLSRMEDELKSKIAKLDSLDNKCDDLAAYNQTLLDEKSRLTKMLAEMEEQAAGSTEGAQMREMERKNGQLRQQLEEIDGQHSAEVEKKDKEVNHLRMMLEDSHYKLAIAESKLASVGNEKEQEIDALKEKVEDLEMDLSAERNRSQELAGRKWELEVQIGHLRSNRGQGRLGHQSTSYATTSFATQPDQLCHQAPDLYRPPNTFRREGLVDGTKSKTEPQYPAHFDPGTARSALDRHCGNPILDNPIEPPLLLARGGSETPPTTTSMTLDLNSPPQAPKMRPSTGPTPTSIHGGPLPSAVSGSSSIHRQNFLQQTPTTPQIHYQSPQAPVQRQAHQTTYSTSPAHIRTTLASPQGRGDYISATPASSYSYMHATAPQPYQRPGVPHTQHPGHYTTLQPGYSASGQPSGGMYNTSQVQHGYHGNQQPYMVGSQPYTTLDSFRSESGLGSMASSSYQSSGYQSGSLGPQGHPRLYERRSSSPHDHVNYPQ